MAEMTPEFQRWLEMSRDEPAIAGDAFREMTEEITRLRSAVDDALQCTSERRWHDAHLTLMRAVR